MLFRLLAILFIIILIFPVKVFSEENSPESIIWKHDLFSPERRYHSLENKNKSEKESNISTKEIKQGLILVGIFCKENVCEALFRVRGALAKKLNKKHLLIKEGKSLGPCVLERIEQAKVIFGECNEQLIFDFSAVRKINPPAPPPQKTENKKNNKSKKKKPFILNRSLSDRSDRR